MSVTATVATLEEGPRNVIVNWTGLGDGFGQENKVVKVNPSTLAGKPGTVKVMRINGAVEYGVVELYWDAEIPVKFASLTGQIDLDYRKAGYPNPKAPGFTGNILLSTLGFELNSAYTLRLEMVKKQ